MEYYVSEKRRLVWNEELKILEAVQDICKRYELKYFAVAGTLIGAVRHDGFIPWDDDIDIGMPREDYEKFIKIAIKELKEPLFLQIPSKDNNYYYGHIKIRNSNTTAIRKKNWETRQTFNQGIFLDIFPFDSVPDNNKKRHVFLNQLRKELKLIKYKHYGFFESKRNIILKSFKYLFAFLNTLFKGGSENQFKIYDSKVKSFNQKNTNEWGMISEFPNSRFIARKEWFDEIEEHKFCGTTIAIPKNYDQILTSSYGDWKIPKQVGSEHGEMFYDVEKSYVEYLGKYKDYKNKDVFKL